MQNKRFGVIKVNRDTFSCEKLFAIVFLLPALFSYLSEIFFALWRGAGFTELSYALQYVIYALIMLKVFSQKPLATIGVFTGAALLIAYSCLINVDVYRHIFNFGSYDVRSFLTSNVMIFATRCVISIALFMSGINIRRLTDYFNKYSLYIVSIYCIMSILSYTVYGQSTNYMNNAYMALIPTALLYAEGMKQKNIKLPLAIISAVFVTISGSRGAALCMILFIGLYHIILGRFNVRKAMIIIGILSLAIIAILNIEHILSWLSNLFAQIGISTRLIDLINGKESGVFHMEDREAIYLNAADEFGFFGSGLFSDRVYRNGGYVHNLVIEIILDFGYLGGVPIILFMLYKVIVGIRKLRVDSQLGVWAPIIIVVIGIKFMASSSFLISQEFWLLIGIAFVSSTLKRTKDRINIL